MLRQKDFGIWKATTWREFGEIAQQIGMGLVALGFEPGERVSILANTVKEWMFTDLGALGAGGVVNGIYPTDSASQCEYLINDSHSVYVFAEDEEQLDKILTIRGQTPHLRKIIVFDTEGLVRYSDPQVMSLDALRQLGRDYVAQHPGAWETRLDIRKPDDLAILVYTSGTTGRPKGAMISHRNLVHVVRGYHQVLGQDERDERICFLPLCHIAERVGGEYSSLYSGSILNFVENPDTVPENVREIAPTCLQMGDRRRPRDCRALHRAQTDIEFLKVQIPDRPLDRPRQRAQDDGHTPLPSACHRRGADFTGLDQMVSRARRADARSLRSNGIIRRVFRHADRPHPPRLGWPRVPLQRNENFSRRRNPGAR
jgi:AMP-binding enzyme